MNDLKKRLPTTIVLLIFAFLTIKFLSITFFSVLLFVIISGAAFEFIKISNLKQYSVIVILLSGSFVMLSFLFTFIDLKWVIILNVALFGIYFLLFMKNSKQIESFVSDFGIHVLIVVYIFLPLCFLLELKKLGSNYLFFLISVIAIGDSGAYFIGKPFGKHKIYPIASPKKSLEGLIAAVISAALSGFALMWVFPITRNALLSILSAAIIGFFSQISDPIESLFKRAAGVKDSSNILPGHGGILDRLDSYIICAPLFTFIVNIFGIRVFQ